MFKKILLVLLNISILLTLLPLTNGSFKVEATSNYSLGCSANEFEVSYIEDNGSLTKVSCHSSFAEASSVMKQNEDYVVRHSGSYSDTKIIAMNSGLTYSYPARRYSSIMNIYQDPDNIGKSTYKSTYVAEGYEMNYYGTTSYSSDGTGYVKVVLYGFEGYAPLEYVDLVPFKYVNKKLSIYVGGEYGSATGYSHESPFLFKPVQNFYRIEKNSSGNYYDLVFYYHVAGPNNREYALHVDNGQNYFDAGMVADTKYFSDDGINFYSDYNFKNYVATVYNYYQFLPLRSKTSISADTFNNYLGYMGKSNSKLANMGADLIRYQDRYGVNALIVYAMACQETAYGTSWTATGRNNLFNVAAYDDSVDDAYYFESPNNSIKYQMGVLLRKYMDYNHTFYFGSGVGNKGAGFNVYYASDPYWGAKIAAIAYSIDRYSHNSDGNLTDYNKYTLGFVKDNYIKDVYPADTKWDSIIYKTKDGNDVLYKGRYGSTYQMDYIAIILEDVGNRYKIQSTNPVANGELVTKSDEYVEYDWNASVGYINKSDIVQLNNKPIESEPDDTFKDYEHEGFSSVNQMQLSEDGILTMEGISYISNCDFSNTENIKHTVEIYNLETNELVDTFDCENTDTSWFKINDGFDYTWAGFKGTYDLKQLEKGTYIFKSVTKYKYYDAYTTVLKTPVENLSLLDRVVSDVDYKLTTNDVYGYRVELDISNKLFDYTTTNKPSTRSSMATIDNVTYEEIDGETYATFTGLGMIYYLNYDGEDIEHKLYFVNNDKIIEAETTTLASEFDYQSLYNSSYNMTKICYSGKIKLSDIIGTNRLYLQIKNGEYMDIVEMTNMFDTIYPTLDNEKFTTAFEKNAARSGIILNVTSKQ